MNAGVIAVLLVLLFVGGVAVGNITSRDAAHRYRDSRVLATIGTTVRDTIRDELNHVPAPIHVPAERVFPTAPPPVVVNNYLTQPPPIPQRASYLDAEIREIR